MSAHPTTKKQLGLLPSEWPEFESLEPAAKKASHEDLYAAQCVQYRLPPFERQHLFAKAAMGRLWRFDFSWRVYKLAVEINGVCVRRIQGQLVVLGRHASIQGIRDDNDKIRAAIRLGWSVLPFLQSDVKPELAIRETMRELAARGWKGPAA